MDSVSLAIIGHITTPHLSIDNMPIQPSGAKDVEGVITLDESLVDGLLDIEGFSHLILIYHLHEVSGYSLQVKPFMDTVEHGIFATRSPLRPSPIGMSTVELKSVEGNKIFFSGADMLSGSPLIDIKPFFRQSDNRPNAKSGWLDAKPDDLVAVQQSDLRFK